MDIFEKGSKEKVRFDTIRGLITMEDLWDVALTDVPVCLNVIAVDLYSEINENSVNFVHKKAKVDELLTLKLDIVKHVIAARLDEIDKRKKAADKKIKKNQILDIIAEKEHSSLKDESISKLKKMIKNL